MPTEIQDFFVPAARPRRRRSRRRRRQWYAVGLILLLLAGLPYVLGERFIELELIVAQPLLRIVLLLAAAACAWFGWRGAGARGAGLSALVALGLLIEAWHFSGTALLRPPVPPDALHVLTQNVGMDHPSALSGWLTRHPADVVMLQEVYQVQWDEWQRLADRMGYHVLYRELRSDSGMGEVILSRLPLTPLPPISGPSRGPRLRYFCRARVQYLGGTLQVLSVHLESLPIVSGQRQFFGSSSFRLHQSQLLVDALSRSDEPVILAGDLNAAPLYRSIRPLRTLLEDAWPAGGLGLGFTYPAVLPLTRIDAVLQRGFRVLSARVVRIGNSDHQALYVTLIPQSR